MEPELYLQVDGPIFDVKSANYLITYIARTKKRNYKGNLEVTRKEISEAEEGCFSDRERQQYKEALFSRKRHEALNKLVTLLIDKNIVIINEPEEWIKEKD